MRTEKYDWILMLPALLYGALIAKYLDFSLEFGFTLIILTLIIIPLMFTILYLYISKKLMPVSRTVAIVGFPKSGKTTLIISLFGEIFAGRIGKMKIKPRGTKTIERINESLEMLEKGRALGPTKDQDRFSYRGDITFEGHLLSPTYKVEFGDFPGENSLEYTDEYGPVLHTTEYFKWVVDSDALVFVIDLGRYLIEDKQKKAYVAEMTKSLRSAWQHFLDNNEYRAKKVIRQPLVLVFTKADLFGLNENMFISSRFEKEIAKLGFGTDIPPIKEIDYRAFENGQNQVNEDFAALIQYFKREAPNFQVVFTSSFGLLKGERVGFKDLISAVLPR